MTTACLRSSLGHDVPFQETTPGQFWSIQLSKLLPSSVSHLCLFLPQGPRCSFTLGPLGGSASPFLTPSLHPNPPQFP